MTGTGLVSGDQVVVPDQTYYVEVIGGGPLRQAGVYPIRAKGTFVANGSSTVNVPFPAITVDTLIDIDFNTLGGSQGAEPVVVSKTPGTGFGVQCTAGDTSTYNWQAQKP